MMMIMINQMDRFVIKINRTTLELKAQHSVVDSSDKPVGEGGEVVSSSS